MTKPVRLQVIQPKQAPNTARSLTRTLLQLWRFSVFCSVIAMLHWQHSQLVDARSASLDGAERLAWQLAQVRRLEPSAHSLRSATVSRMNCCEILDAQQQLLGYAAFTLPIASRTLGFSGPTNTLLLFAPTGRLRSATILESSDTRDHVESIKQDPNFLPALRDRTPEQLRTIIVDGVSGATLTSLAILESIRLRCSPNKVDSPPAISFQGLKFPSEITREELLETVPDVDHISPNLTSGLFDLFDAKGQLLGHLLRLSPAADNTIGYQGPTDAVLLLSVDLSANRLLVRSSYDNEPYTSYVAEDDYFCNLFNGFTLQQIAELDAARIEGVSGATMTSQAVAQGVVQAATEFQAFRSRLDQLAKAQSDRPARSTTKISLRDLSTLLITVGGCLFALTRLKQRRTFRLCFQLTLIGWLGVINGDMLSQALWLGWAQHGISWPKSIGLVGLSAAAICLPLISGHNAYCAHLCPHGAVQQLLRGRLKWHLKLSRRAQQTLRILPVSLLLLVVAIGLLHLPISPVDLEPFDAWIWTISGTASIAIAVVGLLFSLVVPMGYCRFGCPTGALLNGLRRTGPRWAMQDTVATLLFGMSAVVVALS